MWNINFVTSSPSRFSLPAPPPLFFVWVVSFLFFITLKLLQLSPPSSFSLVHWERPQ